MGLFLAASGLAVIIANQVYFSTARQSLWTIFFFNLVAILVASYLTSTLLLLREHSFQRYFDPFNSLVYLISMLSMAACVYQVFVVAQGESSPGSSADFFKEKMKESASGYSFLLVADAHGIPWVTYSGVFATLLKALILLLKPPRRALENKADPNA